MCRPMLVALLFVAACGGPRLVAYEPLERKTELDQKKLYDAAEGTLLDRGYLLEKRDETSFELETEPRTLLGSEIGKTKFKYVWTVSTAGGTLKIRLRCKQATGSDTQDCGKETPEKIVKEQAMIAEQAVKEAQGK